MMKQTNACYLCPRRCGADRNTKRGVCGCGATLRVARAAPHFWEEPCISGQNGSGTVFFSGCNLKCVFCQNRALRDGQEGIEITTKRLSEIFLELQGAGVHNINLITPTPWVMQIREALELAWQEGLWLPVVYNSSGYELPETLKLLRGYIRIYLPDFKYMDSQLAGRFSGAYDYPEQAKRALYEMVSQRGEAIFDENGRMLSGVIVRHLVLPGHTDDSMQVLQYLKQEYGDSILISIMNQYTPMPGMEGELAGRLSPEEYRQVVAYAESIGLTNGFLQEGDTAKESFIPDWNGFGVLGR